MEIGLVAQRAMDLYYGQYKTDEDYFGLDDFISQVKSEYANIITNEYNNDKLLNKQLHGFSFVTIPNDLLKSVDIEVKNDGGQRYADLPAPVFIFPYDSMNSGVQYVLPLINKGDSDIVSSNHGAFVKVSVNDRWQLELITHGTRNYYSIEYQRIVFDKLYLKELKKIRVVYVPEVSSLKDDDQISDGRVSMVENAVLQKMLAAKNGAIVDMSNDSNTNKVVETEINKKQLED